MVSLLFGGLATFGGSFLLGGSLLSGGRYFRDLLAATKNGRYFRGVATFGGSLLSELYGRNIYRTNHSFTGTSPSNLLRRTAGKRPVVLVLSRGFVFIAYMSEWLVSVRLNVANYFHFIQVFTASVPITNVTG